MQSRPVSIPQSRVTSDLAQDDIVWMLNNMFSMWNLRSTSAARNRSKTIARNSSAPSHQPAMQTGTTIR